MISFFIIVVFFHFTYLLIEMFYYIVHYFTQWTQDCNWQTQTTRAEMARNVWWLGKMDEQKIQKGKNNTCSIFMTVPLFKIIIVCTYW